MTVHNTMGVVGKATDGTAVPVVTPTNVRNTLSAFLKREYSSAKVRTGRIKGAAGGMLFVSAGTGWTYRVEPGALVYAASATGGAYVVTNDTQVTLTTSPSPSNGSRVDIIYMLQKDAFDGSSDETRAVIDLAQGTAVASGTPQNPTLPAGAIMLARNVMQSTATSTSSSGNNLSNLTPYTVMAGGVGYYGSVADMRADPSRYYGDVGYSTGDDRLYVRLSGGQSTSSSVEKAVAWVDDTQLVQLRGSGSAFTSGAIIRDTNERTIYSVSVTVPAGTVGTVRGYCRAWCYGTQTIAGNLRLKYNSSTLQAGRIHNHGKAGASQFTAVELGAKINPGTYTLSATIQADGSSGDMELWDGFAEFVVEY